MAIKNSQRFSELEYCLSQYFSRHLAPVMSSVQSDLQNKKSHEAANYKNSAGGILNAMVDASHMIPGIDTATPRLQVTGEWNSKTTDDYLNMVRKQIAGNKTIQKDIAVMASEWRKIVIDEVGRTAYDNASKQIGADLAYAYIDYRFEEQMLDKMVRDRMPKSSVGYILRNAADRSLLGLNSILKDSPADREINERVEAIYKPSIVEKTAARGTSFVMDAITMGGSNSWGALAKMAGVEVVFAGMEAYSTGKNASKKQISVEECISRGLFGSKSNVFTTFRKNANIARTWEHPNLISLNSRLSKKLGIFDSKPMFTGDNAFFKQQKSFFDLSMLSSKSQAPNNREGIPSVIALGKEDEYRESLKKSKQEQTTKPKEEKKEEKKEEIVTESVLQNEETEIPSKETVSEETITEKQNNANISGWDGLLQSFGLDGLSATGQNLGYVIAMLPDILFGALTGKSKNLGLEDNLLPIASVLVGLFVKNPLLKMTLIGLGGANLLNKAGKEALDRQESQTNSVQSVHQVQEVRYKQYEDEQLNARIGGVSIQGGALLCTIDKVPCTISLPPSTVAAYEVGALPLNTLANAILTRHDAMQEELALNYQRQYDNTRQQSAGASIK